MNKDTIDNISDLIEERLDLIYNTSVLMANTQLLKHYKSDVKDWEIMQRKEIPQLKRDINKVIKKEWKELSIAIERAVLLIYAVSEGTFKDLDVNDKKIEIRANVNAKKTIQELQTRVSATLNKLPTAIQKAQVKNITSIANKVGIQPQFKRMESLYEGIVSHTQTTSSLNNAPKIVYKDKRMVGFREYMNMNVRTTFQQSANEFQMQSAKDNGLVFYLCSSHADCANDHADYQGKMYIDENWESIVNSEEERNQIEAYLLANKIETIQSVRDNAPYLVTRPNCRHYLMPVSTEEVVMKGNTTAKLLKDKNMLKGKYDKDNYIDLQKQRHNERQIRKYKLDYDTKLKQFENTPDTKEKEFVKKKLDKASSKIRQYQKANRELVASNKALDRDYDRENPRILVNDLGRRYDVKYYKK